MSTFLAYVRVFLLILHWGQSVLINWNSLGRVFFLELNILRMTFRAYLHYRSINQFPGKFLELKRGLITLELPIQPTLPARWLIAHIPLAILFFFFPPPLSTKSEKSNQVQTYLQLLFLLLFVYSDDLLTNLRLIKTTNTIIFFSSTCLNYSHFLTSRQSDLSSKLFYLSIGLHDKCERVFVLYL